MKNLNLNIININKFMQYIYNFIQTHQNQYSIDFNKKNQNNTLYNIMNIRKTKKKLSNKKKDVEEIDEEEEKQQKKDHFIGKIDQAPDYVRDNQHIIKGYRINFDSPKKVLKSLFMIHNESVNIWTHLFGAIFVIMIICYVGFYLSPHGKQEEYKNRLNKELDRYVDKLKNITFLKEIKVNTQQSLKLLKQQFRNNYDILLNKTNIQLQKYDQAIQKYKNKIQKQFQSLIIKLVSYTQKIQTQLFQNFVHNIQEVTTYLNNSYIYQFQKQIQHAQIKFIQITDSQYSTFFDLYNIPNPYKIPKWPLFIFLFSATTCLLLSSLFHLFLTMSPKTYKIFSRLDYAGVNILIAGSCFPSFMYGLYCKKDLALFYLTIISFIGLFLFILSIFDFMHTPKYRLFKSLCYGGYGAFLIVPLTHVLIHQIYFSQGDQFRFNSLVPFYLCIGFSYLGGLYVYTVKCPERNNPGKYDICGHSHQIWHLCVILGIIFTYVVSLLCFNQRKHFSCPVINNI